MIEIKNLTKKYDENSGNFDINLKIEPGEVFGILGPNGAGKTTLIRQLMGFIKPDSGHALLNGLESFANAKKIMEDTGYVAGEISLFESWKATTYLKIITLFRDNIDKDFYKLLLEHFSINPDKKIKKMSKGMKQKIAIIAATMFKPKVLILDEPTSGLDPVMKIQFNKLVYKLKKEGITIFLASHILSEVTELCDRVGFLRQGKLIETMEIDKKNTNAVENRFKKIFEMRDFL